ERAAAAVGRQRAGAREEQRYLGRQHQLYAPRQRGVALAQPQALAGDVNRDERGRACSVDRHVRTVEAEHVRQTARREAEAVAGAVVRADEITGAGDQPASRVVVLTDPAKPAGARLAQRIGRLAAALERLPRDFEQQTLLRIEALGFARRQPEERCVEQIDAVEERAVARVDRPA